MALVAGLALAWVFSPATMRAREAPPASQGGLMVETGRDDDAKLDPKRPLRCFVNGQFVGELPLAVCAQRNGVATGALDVGSTPPGSLAASNGIGADITPLPPQQPQPVTGGDPANGQRRDRRAGSGSPPPHAAAGQRPCMAFGIGRRLARAADADVAVRPACRPCSAAAARGPTRRSTAAGATQTLRLTERAHRDLAATAAISTALTRSLAAAARAAG